MLAIGSLVDGKYKILNEIGHGGMSVVYLAIVERANQTWAIKEVRKNGATKDDIVQQGLVAEMNILKRLNHAHLPRIIDIIDYEDSFLIVMDYIEGVDLDKKLREGPQKWEDVVEWSKQLCDVFAYLHSRQPPIIYRDMKPGNVKLKPDGNVVLFDFGTAREYKSQKAGDDTTCLGTRGYASPEQYGGMGQTDSRSDIYCLGATMYHLVTGQIPGGPPDYKIFPIRSICNWLPKTGKAGNCVRGLEKIIMKCLQPNPADRYQNCAELMYDLEHIDRISDEFVKAQKKKLKTWIACIACTLAFSLTGVLFGVLANKTVSNEYNESVAAAFKQIYSSEVKPDDPTYSSAESNFKEAIKMDPSNADAWLYLAKLYASDSYINPTELKEMNDLLETNKINGKGEIFKKNNNSGYARFCVEWGTDLFFLYGNQKEDRGTYPKNATPYLQYIIGGSNDDANKEDKDTCIARLVNEKQSTVLQCPEGFSIALVDQIIATQQYDLANSLYPIAVRAESLNEKDGYKTSYSVDDYIVDVEKALNIIADINDAASSIQKNVIEIIFRWQTLVAFKSILISDKNMMAYNEVVKIYDEANAKFNGSQNVVVIENLTNLKNTYDSIVGIRDWGK